MLGNRKLILDVNSEVYRELWPWADGEFWDITKHKIIPGAVYVFCREHVNRYVHEICTLAESQQVTVVIENAAEGSETLVTWCFVKGLLKLIEERKVLLLAGGDMDPAKWPYMSFEYFLPKILDFDENVDTASRIDEYFAVTDKPYKFLFLNGRMRTHRKYLLERFRANGVLPQALWTNLDTDMALITGLPQERWLDYNNVDGARIRCMQSGVDIMERPFDLNFLPKKYEMPYYRDNIDNCPREGTIKNRLFGDTWGDALVHGTAYRDTYFSVVTETVFSYPYSFRTEKIWKPVAIGHPWIAVANQGFYRDIRNLGFQTFAHVIDESFDAIENNQERLQRVATVVEDLCRQDLVSFYKECYNVCKYNQQHYAEYRHRVPRELPAQFQQFLEKYQ